jgi:hypothetical protein
MKNTIPANRKCRIHVVTEHFANMSRKETEFQLNISRDNAEQLKSSGEASGGNRGKNYAGDSFKIPSDEEATQMETTGEVSREKHQHPTENIAEEYKRGSNSGK